MADKGALKRLATVKLYADEIEELYANPREIPLSKVPPLDMSSQAALGTSIEKLLREHLGVPHLDADTDFFAAGMDSLQIIAAARFITASLRATTGDVVDDHGRHGGGGAVVIEARDVYNHASPMRLAGHILEAASAAAAAAVLANGTTTMTTTTKENNAQEAEAQSHRLMDQMYKTMTRNLIRAKPGRPEPAREQQTVILTGSTGNMGCYLLDELMRNPRIKKIVCLNRSADGGAGKQAKAMEERGLCQPPPPPPSPPAAEGGGKGNANANANANTDVVVEFLHADLARPDLGLPRAVYSRLLGEADRIVHNAWAVNFNMPLEAFRPHVQGVRHLADLAAAAAKRVVVVFVSTIGATSGWDAGSRGGPVPETSVREYGVSGPMGYGQSKLVSGMVLEDAAEVGDFSLAVVRVGQIAGPLADDGAWSRQEWLPSIVASSLVLGALPSHLAGMNEVAWVPVETMARVVLDIGGLTEESTDYHEGYFHGVNPSVTLFDQLAPWIREYYGTDRLPELVGFRDWVDRLEASRNQPGALGADRNPGLKLVDFYRGAASSGEDDVLPRGTRTTTHETRRTVSCSPALRSVQPITPELMVHWCKQWNFEGASARGGRL
ncbi:Linear gramicidin synthase subunit D [Colletotrichum tanaceti]|uniref:Linear gramicidin synthase subunit D n=1 Tax=Colletotrichum tanaceti TaxID=1306861 RepID=A0A4U6WZC2_9PEZI|nr:Linear gramicidin synthase subunit D [Colletotrichum tanaceti]TKW48235.1 Linear gramicidin synthase subunit D [Colletotrichum tanaceti]